MKDQLKKTFSDASKQIPTKKRNYQGRRYIFNWGFQSNDNRRINLMQNKNTILSHHQISSKQMIRNWILIGYLHNRSNYYNYNRRNIISRHYQQQPKVRSTQNNMKQIQQIQWWKNPGDRNGIQLRCHICESHYHGESHYPELPREIRYSITQEVVLYQSDFDHTEIENTCFRIMESRSFRQW